MLVLESMKMRLLPAPFAGRVKELLVAAGSQVETGAALVRLEPTGDPADAGAAADVDAPDLDPPDEVADREPTERVARGRADLAAMLLGYDLDPSQEQRTLTGYPRPATRSRRRAHRRSTTRSPCSGSSPTRRAEPQPTRRGGGAPGEPGTQPARALPHLPGGRRIPSVAHCLPTSSVARAGAQPLRGHLRLACRRW